MTSREEVLLNTIVYIRSTSIFNDSRATKEILSLNRLGYKVIVIGWNRDGIAEKECKELFKGKEIEVIFFNKLLPHGSGMKGIFKILQFNLFIKKQLKRLHSHYAFIHACDLDTSIFLRKLAKKLKKKYVYDIYDYYIEAHTLPGVLKKRIERMEIKLINAADCVIVCSKQRTQQISKAHPKRLEYIYNTPNLKNILSNCPISRQKNSRLKIAYFGVLSEDRLLKEIGDKICQRKDFQLLIGGNGKYYNYFKRLSDENENVDFYGQIAYEKVLILESQSDVLFATYNPTIPNHKYSAPNKVYEAMALNKPIIVCNNTGVDKMVDEFHFGYTIDYNADEFFDALNYILLHPDEAEKMGLNGRNAYNEYFSWDIMELRLKEIYKNLKCDRI